LSKDATTSFGLTRKQNKSSHAAEELLMPSDQPRVPLTDTQILRHLKEQPAVVYDNNNFFQKQMRKLHEKKSRMLSSTTKTTTETDTVRLKDRVPKISEGDFKDLLERYPMNKAEIMTYLLKLH
jgi:predicted subunit of tRNA(5-methylaminomethyl-2-thiouridylate) methyltransferase